MLTPDFELQGRQFAVRNPGAVLTPAALSALEQQIGLPLPPQLRSYYQRFNGGLPYPLDVAEFSSLGVRLPWQAGQPARRAGVIGSVGSMLQVDSEIQDFLDCWLTFKDRIPSGLLPFQRSAGGSLFLIGTSDNTLGRIYFWARDFEADEEAGEMPSYANLVEVAPSFLEFLAAFRDAEGPAGETSAQWIARNYPD